MGTQFGEKRVIAAIRDTRDRPLGDRHRRLEVPCGRVGGGEGVEMGPVISAKAKDRIVGLIDDAEKRGSKVVLDGRGLTVPGYENGHFLGPTVLDDVPLDAPVYTEEVFGPVLAIVHADTYEEALKIVKMNASF